MSAPHAPIVTLRAAAVWGTTVLATDNLTPGRSLKIGDGEGAVIAKPDTATVSDSPIRAVGNGWELDTRGATGGEVHLRGRMEDPADLGRVGAPIPIVAGDFGRRRTNSLKNGCANRRETPGIRVSCSAA